MDSSTRIQNRRFFSSVIILTAVIFLFVDIPPIESTPVSSHENSPGSTRSHSDEETHPRPSCQVDKDCDHGYFCFKRMKDISYCFPCVTCQGHRRKPGWTQCAKTLNECGGCEDGLSGITCLPTVKDPSGDDDKQTEEPAHSSFVPTATIAIVLAILGIFIVVGLVVPGFLGKYNELPFCRQICGSREESNELGQRTKMVDVDESPFTTDGELTPLSRSRSASGQDQEPKPSAPYLPPPPPPYNPSFYAQCQMNEAPPNEESQISTDGGGPQRQRHTRRFRETHRRAFPYVPGAGAGAAAERHLESARQQAVEPVQAALVAPENVPQVVEQNEGDFGTVPQRFGIEDEESFDLGRLIAGNADNGGPAAEVPGNGPPNNVRVIPNPEPVLLSPDRLSREESRIFGVSDSIIYVQGEIRLSIFSPFTTHSQIQMPQQGYHDRGWDRDHDPIIHHFQRNPQQPVSLPEQNENSNDVDIHVVPEGKNCQ